MDNPTDNTPFFYGHSENRLNSKGQIALPKRFRSLLNEERLQEGFVLIPGEQECLYMYTHRQFGTIRSAVRALAKEQNDPEFFRCFMEEAEAIDLDTQGRLLLPKSLRGFAGIDGPEVLFLGMDDRIEIWAPQKREQERGNRESYRKQRGVSARRIFGL